MNLLDHMKHMRYLKFRNFLVHFIHINHIDIIHKCASDFFLYFCKFFILTCQDHLNFKWAKFVMNKVIHSGLMITFLRFGTGLSVMFSHIFYVVSTASVSRHTRHLLLNTYDFGCNQIVQYL